MYLRHVCDGSSVFMAHFLITSLLTDVLARKSCKRAFFFFLNAEVLRYITTTSVPVFFYLLLLLKPQYVPDLVRFFNASSSHFCRNVDSTHSWLPLRFFYSECLFFFICFVFCVQ